MKPAEAISPAQTTTGAGYYRRVADYYDVDAQSFEERSRQNLVLQRVREEFRRESDPFANGRILEIGFGPGFDLIHWAERRPQAEVHGVDVSPGMQACAARNLQARAMSRVRLAVGTIEDVPTLFPGVRFNFVYCYFGALNTTADLRQAARSLHRVLTPEGTAVLTFVNRWYLAEMIYGLIRLRWRKAFARLQPVWGGYANERRLESRCFSPAQVRAGFGPDFNVIDRRGYCILYPAWYRNPRWVHRHATLSDCLWRADRLLNRTPLWSLGEYALYILQPRR